MYLENGLNDFIESQLQGSALATLKSFIGEEEEEEEPAVDVVAADEEVKLAEPAPKMKMTNIMQSMMRSSTEVPKKAVEVKEEKSKGPTRKEKEAE